MLKCRMIVVFKQNPRLTMTETISHLLGLSPVEGKELRARSNGCRRTAAYCCFPGSRDGSGLPTCLPPA